MTAPQIAAKPPSAFWSISAAEMLQQLGTTGEGLAGDEARQRLARYGSNLLKPQARSNALTLLLGQFKSPIVLLLLFATGLSFFLHDPVNAFIILAIVLASGLLGFWQEHSATRAVEKLLAMVQIKATALRDGKPQDIAVEEIVPGDIVILNAGDLVLVSSSFTTTKVCAGGCFGHANAVSKSDVRPRTRSQGACWPLAIDVKASLLPSSVAMELWPFPNTRNQGGPVS